MLKNAFFAFMVFFALFITAKIFSFGKYLDSDDLTNKFNDHYHIYAVHIPKDIDFAGEKVPLDDFDVVERLDRELIVNTYYQSSTLLLHKRANRWFPIIEPILKKNNIPNDFKYLALAESGLSNQVSPKNAVGFWQLIEETAKQYGLEINNEVDERYNVVKSTETACKYLLNAYKELNSWALVAASYNMGIGGVRKQLSRQKATSYYDLILNEETSRYVFRLLAIKEIISKPKEYGYILQNEDLYNTIPTYTVNIDTSVESIADFAHDFDIHYKTLKIFNPWLRQAYLHNTSRKKYEILIPKSIKNYNQDIESQLIYSNAPEYLDSTFQNFSEVWYVAGKSDNLNLIAKKYNVSVENLIKWNQLKEDVIEEYQELIIFIAKKE